MINKTQNDPSKTLDIIQNITKKYNRLSLDVKHQQEKIDLMYKHELESSLSELSMIGSASLIFEEITLDGNFDNYLSKEHKIPYLVSMESSYSEEDKKIFEIANKYGKNNDASLIKSNIEVLKDKEMPESERLTAADRIKTFLMKSGKKALKHAEDIGVKVLTTYLEKLAKGELN